MLTTLRAKARFHEGFEYERLRLEVRRGTRIGPKLQRRSWLHYGVIACHGGARAQGLRIEEFNQATSPAVHRARCYSYHSFTSSLDSCKLLSHHFVVIGSPIRFRVHLFASRPTFSQPQRANSCQRTRCGTRSRASHAHPDTRDATRALQGASPSGAHTQAPPRTARRRLRGPRG